MLSILEEPQVRENAAPLSIAAYRLLGEKGLIGTRTELIEGVVIEKMSKSPKHARLVQMLVDWLNGIIGQSYFVQSEQPLTINNSEPEPDLALIKGEPQNFLNEHPSTAELVIEISFTTVGLDRAKSNIYAAANIPRYLLINLEAKNVEEYLEPVDGKYTVLNMLNGTKLKLWQDQSFDLELFFK